MFERLREISPSRRRFLAVMAVGAAVIGGTTGAAASLGINWIRGVNRDDRVQAAEGDLRGAEHAFNSNLLRLKMDERRLVVGKTVMQVGFYGGDASPDAAPGSLAGSPVAKVRSDEAGLVSAGRQVIVAINRDADATSADGLRLPASEEVTQTVEEAERQAEAYIELYGPIYR